MPSDSIRSIIESAKADIGSYNIEWKDSKHLRLTHQDNVDECTACCCPGVVQNYNWNVELGDMVWSVNDPLAHDLNRLNTNTYKTVQVANELARLMAVFSQLKSQYDSGHVAPGRMAMGRDSKPAIPSNSSTTVITRSATGKVGIGFRRDDGSFPGPCIINVLSPNGPAAESGKIQVGDLLYSVNNVNVYDLSIAEVQKLFKGDPETQLTVVTATQAAAAASSEASSEATMVAAPSESPDVSAKLATLSQLRESGALSEEQYQKAVALALEGH